jgi:catechol 2,3-dioxygenase-like lactoylglutathione lyase family enzyme
MPRVSDVRFIAYAVPDLEAERRFYVDTWGLIEVAHEDDLVHLAAPGSPEKFVVRLRQAAERSVELIGWAAETRADVDALHAHLTEMGATVISAPAPLAGLGGGYGFRVFDLDGHALEISAEVERGPCRVLTRNEAAPIKISHIVFHTPKVATAVDWYEKALGFRVSDWLGDFMCFLRCNSWHHRLAFVPGPPALNHVAYDVPSVDAMMRGVAKLRRAEHDVVWGPGRHTAGDNTFSYFISPGEFVVEYTSELVEVDDETWVATVHKPSLEIMDQWGYGVGGPKDMPAPIPDALLWRAPAL